MNSANFGLLVQPNPSSGSSNNFYLYNAAVEVTYTSGTSVSPTSLTFSVPIVNDNEVEGDESYSIGIANASSTSAEGASIATGTAATTIVDNDISFSISGSSTVTEDPTDGDNNQATYTVGFSGVLSSGATASVTVAHNLNQTTSADFSNTLSSAIAAAISAGATGVSFDSGTGVLTFTGGSGNATSLTFSLDISDDSENEPVEQFSIALSNASAITPHSASIGTASVTTTITSDDLQESIVFSITGQASVTETTSDGDENKANFTIGYSGTLPAGATASVVVTHNLDETDGSDFSNSLNSAIATAIALGATGISYDDTTRVLTFTGGAGNDTELAFSLLIENDALIEDDEQFNLVLSGETVSSPHQVSIASATAATTIVSDDLPPAVSFSISGPAVITEATNDADGNLAEYTIGYSGTLNPGESASVVVEHVLNETTSGDYDASVYDAIATAVAATPGTAFDTETHTLTFSNTTIASSGTVSGYPSVAIDAGDGDYSWSDLASATGNTPSTAASQTGVDHHDVANTIRLSNFGLNVPAGATIAGITVTLVTTGSNNSSSAVKLTKTGSSSVGTTPAAAGTWSSGTVIHGSSTSLWGTSWTAEELNSSSFGVWVQPNGSGNSDDFYVHSVQVEVAYSSSTNVSPTSILFSVPIANDSDVETDESYSITLADASSNAPGGAAVDISSVDTTIVSDDFNVVFFIEGSTQVTELGTDGDLNLANYTIRYEGELQSGATAGVKVNFNRGQTVSSDFAYSLSTAIETALLTAGNGISYDSSTGILTFTGGAGNAASLAFSLEIVDDSIPESPQKYQIALSDPFSDGSAGVTIDPSAELIETTIVSDDIFPPVTLYITGDDTVSETPIDNGEELGNLAHYRIGYNGQLGEGQTASVHVSQILGDTTDEDYVTKAYAAIEAAAAITDGVDFDPITGILTFTGDAGISTTTATGLIPDWNDLSGTENGNSGEPWLADTGNSFPLHADVDHGLYNYPDILHLKSFLLDIPTGATIHGIEVTIDTSGTDTNMEARLWLSTNGLFDYLVEKDQPQQSQYLNHEETLPFSFGGLDDLWGFTASDLSAENLSSDEFSLFLELKGTGGGNNFDHYQLNSVAIEVKYSVQDGPILAKSLDFAVDVADDAELEGDETYTITIETPPDDPNPLAPIGEVQTTIVDNEITFWIEGDNPQVTEDTSDADHNLARFRIGYDGILVTGDTASVHVSHLLDTTENSALESDYVRDVYSAIAQVAAATPGVTFDDTTGILTFEGTDGPDINASAINKPQFASYVPSGFTSADYQSWVIPGIPLFESESQKIYWDTAGGTGVASKNSDQLRLTDFGFDLPENAIIDAIDVLLNTSSEGDSGSHPTPIIKLYDENDPTASVSPGVQLTTNGKTFEIIDGESRWVNADPTDNVLRSLNGWSTGIVSLKENSVNGVAWGRIWTAADLNSDKFGVLVDINGHDQTEEIYNIHNATVEIRYHYPRPKTTTVIEFDVEIKDDNLVEGEEYFHILLDNPENTTVGGANFRDPEPMVTTRIVDNDAADIVFNIDGTRSVSEESGQQLATYTIGYAGELPAGQIVSISVSQIFASIAGATQQDITPDLSQAIQSVLSNYSGVSFVPDADSPSQGILTFTGGTGLAQSITFTLEVVDDQIVEGPESFSIQLSTPFTSAADLGLLLNKDTVNTIIVDNDQITPPIGDISFSIDGPQVVSEESGQRDAAYTISYQEDLDNNEYAEVRVSQLFTTEGGATQADFTQTLADAILAVLPNFPGVTFSGYESDPTTGILRFTYGSGHVSSFTFTLTVNDDPLRESDESFAIRLSEPVASDNHQDALILVDTAKTTILDNDQNGGSGQVSYSIDGTSVVSEVAGQRQANYQVSYTGDQIGGAYRILISQWFTPEGVATESDLTESLYDAITAALPSYPDVSYIADPADPWWGTLQFNAIPGSDRTFSFTLNVADDALIESEEWFEINLSSPIGGSSDAAVKRSTVRTTILDNDAEIVFSLNGGGTVTEYLGDADNNQAQFSVGYSGTLQSWEIASLDIEHLFDQTDSSDYIQGESLSAAIKRAIADLQAQDPDGDIGITFVADPASLNRGTLTFRGGTGHLDSLPFYLSVRDDHLVENIEEEFAIRIANPLTNAIADNPEETPFAKAIIAPPATVESTIISDESIETFPVVFSVSGPTDITEDPSAGGQIATYRVSYEGALPLGESAGVVVNFDFIDTTSSDFENDLLTAINSAIGASYPGVSATVHPTIPNAVILTFASGYGFVSYFDFQISAADDELLEGKESFAIRLSDATSTYSDGAVIDIDSAFTDIVDNEVDTENGGLSITITGSSTVTEDPTDSDFNQATYTISLNGTLPVGETASVVVSLVHHETDKADFTTSLIPAIEFALKRGIPGVSFNSATRTLTFVGGENNATSLTFSLIINDEYKLVNSNEPGSQSTYRRLYTERPFEDPERFSIVLSNPGGTVQNDLQITTSSAQTTIANNNGDIVFYIRGDSSGIEGGGLNYTIGYEGDLYFGKTASVYVQHLLGTTVPDDYLESVYESIGKSIGPMSESGIYESTKKVLQGLPLISFDPSSGLLSFRGGAPTPVGSSESGVISIHAETKPTSAESVAAYPFPGSPWLDVNSLLTDTNTDYTFFESIGLFSMHSQHLYVHGLSDLIDHTFLAGVLGIRITLTVGDYPMAHGVGSGVYLVARSSKYDIDGVRIELPLVGDQPAGQIVVGLGIFEEGFIPSSSFTHLDLRNLFWSIYNPYFLTDIFTSGDGQSTYAQVYSENIEIWYHDFGDAITEPPPTVYFTVLPAVDTEIDGGEQFAIHLTDPSTDDEIELNQFKNIAVGEGTSVGGILESSGGIEFSIYQGNNLQAEDFEEAIEEEIPFNVHYSGDLLDGQTASVRIVHLLDRTTHADYSNDLIEAIETAIAAGAPGVTFDRDTQTLEFTGGAGNAKEITFSLKIAEDDLIEGSQMFGIKLYNATTNNPKGT
ncbi:MAG: hypothetical protein KDA68_03740, partial [Planctomycetaceae bacterium]|nr:hypothetical protein [Planctomycetaceae bacterium]